MLYLFPVKSKFASCCLTPYVHDGAEPTDTQLGIEFVARMTLRTGDWDGAHHHHVMVPDSVLGEKQTVYFIDPSEIQDSGMMVGEILNGRWLIAPSEVDEFAVVILLERL